MNVNNDIIDATFLSDEDRIHLGESLRTRNIDNANSAHPQPEIRDSLYIKYGKRVIDIILSVPALVISIPVNLVLAFLTLRDVGRPILFHQERVGKDGRVFRITKFRSMTNETDKYGNLLPGEERVTEVGKRMRASSLDELFNFWNIFKGDMSIIGPRPLLPEYTNRYCDYHAARLSVKPGLECPTPVHVNHALTWEEQFNNDVWYAANVSFVTDCKLMWRMVRTVFNRKQSAARGMATRSFFMGYNSQGVAIGLKEVPVDAMKSIVQDCD